MRLIDADALKMAIHCHENRQLPLDTVIDNAPTVDISEIISKFRNTAYQNGLETGLNKRPSVEACYQTISCLDCKNYDKEHYFCPRFCEVIREVIKNEG